MKIAITGSSGFVGRQAARILSDAGHVLYLYDVRHHDDPAGKSIFPIIGNLITGEGLSLVPWNELDIVVHLAAAGVKASHRRWAECLQVNVTGTQQLLEHLRSVENPPRLVYARTFYENHLNVPALSENPYVATKRTASDLIRIYQCMTGAPVTSATLYQAYGPGDDVGNVLSYIVNQLRRSQAALLGSGKGLRDWIYIDDLVAGLVFIITAPVGDYDLGSGKLYSLKSVAWKIADLMEADRSLLEFGKERDRGDSEIIDQAENFIPGWEPSCSLNEGLAKMIEAMKDDAV